jgi:hypothetical protein
MVSSAHGTPQVVLAKGHHWRPGVAHATTQVHGAAPALEVLTAVCRREYEGGMRLSVNLTN